MALPAVSVFSSAARSLLFFTALVLSACATAFAPAYDPAIVTGFNQANERALVLFSALSGGSSVGAYPRFADQYDEVVGAFDALRLQAEARLASELPEQVRDRVCQDRQSDTCTNNPSPFNLAGLTSNLTTMKRRHATEGLTPGYVQLRKIDHDIYARHVLVVEEYLRSERR